jgi:hypothetical protein
MIYFFKLAMIYDDLIFMLIQLQSVAEKCKELIFMVSKLSAGSRQLSETATARFFAALEMAGTTFV